MREPTLCILLALLRGPAHGYAVAKLVDELSDGRVRLTAGTLYGALDRLVETNLIEVSGEEMVKGRRRRYYRITDQGREAALGEVHRMRSLVRVAETVDPSIGGGAVGGGAVAR